MKRIAFLLFVLFSPVHIGRAQETYAPPTRAAFEFSTTYIRTYDASYTPWRSCIDVSLDGQTRRIYLDQAVKLTCFDSYEKPHEAYMLPGSKVQPITLDTFVILDMIPDQCLPMHTLSFVGDNGVEVYYRVLFVTGPRGQMQLFDPE